MISGAQIHWWECFLRFSAQELQILLISPTDISLQLRSVLEMEGLSSQTHSLSFSTNAEAVVRLQVRLAWPEFLHLIPFVLPPAAVI